MSNSYTSYHLPGINPIVGMPTERQVDILKRSDLPDKLIALELNISYYTVTTHMQNMRLKFGFKSKHDMVKYATTKGYIA